MNEREPLPKDVLITAKAVVASARLNAMSREYAPALLPPLRRSNASNQLRYKSALLGRVISNARPTGSGMCEFVAVNLISPNSDRVRCVAPARIAIHIQTADTIEMIGTRGNDEHGGFFGIEEVRSAR